MRFYTGTSLYYLILNCHNYKVKLNIPEKFNLNNKDNIIDSRDFPELAVFVLQGLA